MLYLTQTWTREHVIASEPKIASALLESVRMVEKWRKEGKVLHSGFVGPMTPLRILVIHEAKSHEELWERLTSLPCIPYCHTEIKPMISLDNVDKYLGRFVKAP